MERPAPFLPDPEHVAYVSNLLTVLGVLLGIYAVLRIERAHRQGRAPGGPTEWSWAQ